MGDRSTRRDRRKTKREPGPLTMLPGEAPPPRPPLFALFVVGLAIVAVVGLEAGVDLAQYADLRRGVVAVDVLLVLAFAGWIGWTWVRRVGPTSAWVLKRRWDVFLVVVSLLLLGIVPRVAAAFVIGRALVAVAALGLDTTIGRAAVRGASLKPTQTLALSFLAVIVVGAVLLTFPAATVDGRGASFTDAVFTATSAGCITGLAVVDTGSYFTPFGQVVILLCVQLGGLGIQVLGAAFAVLVGGRLPIRQQVGLGSLLDVTTAEGLKILITSIFAVTALFELAGTIVFFAGLQLGVVAPQAGYESAGAALWWSFFHAVSAFNNAGFTLSSTGLMPWVGDPLVCGVVGTLVTVGSVGFFVIADLARERMREIARPRVMWGRLSLQTRVVLVMTLALNVIGMLLFLFFEYDGALQGLTVVEKLLASAFQSTMLRSAGFNTVPFGDLAPPTIIFCVVWMFVGAGPGGTGGGVKVTTAAVVFTAVRSMLRGRSEVEMFGRTVPQTVVYRSISIMFISGVAVAVLLGVLTSTQDLAFERLLFEVTSAFATTGFSMDTTPLLDGSGRWTIVVAMYVGRVGPLTLALAVGERIQPQGFLYPEGRLAVG